MTASNRSNPLALAVLLILQEQPMHPYEVATLLRRRNKHQSVRLNYGSPYAAVASLEKRGLIARQATAREGRFPERTIYALTGNGKVEARNWLTELLAVPRNDFPAFGVGLAFLPALSPDDAAALLRQRAHHLEVGLANARSAREHNQSAKIPRAFWIEGEFRAARNEAELSYVLRLHSDIESGSLGGLDWWRAVHESPYQAEGSLLATGVSHQVEVGK